jgi:hypothetical protein
MRLTKSQNSQLLLLAECSSVTAAYQQVPPSDEEAGLRPQIHHSAGKAAEQEPAGLTDLLKKWQQAGLVKQQQVIRGMTHTSAAASSSNRLFFCVAILICKRVQWLSSAAV